MFRRNFYLDRFLDAVTGTETFRDYCAARGIPFETPSRDHGGSALVRDWQQALSRLPEQARSDVDLELSQVNDLAHRDSLYHLMDVCADRDLNVELVVGEEAQALWFLLHHPSLFQDVFFSEEVLETESWVSALTDPGIALADHASRRAAFEWELKHFFKIGRFCASQSYRFEGSECVVFIGFVSDRMRLLETFTESGEHRRQKVQPASQVLFAYYPTDGTVLLKSRLRAARKVRALLQMFCRSVLAADLDESSLGLRFDLDRLLTRFDPPLPEGVAMVRVKALELAYPSSGGRRRLRLETNAADGQFAILDLLQAHVGGESLRATLHVAEAELQVKLSARGRLKSHFIRLRPNRCSLNQTPAADLLRQCLSRWGLLYAPQP